MKREKTMIEIKPEDLQLMWVWDSMKTLKKKAWVICKWGSGVLAIDHKQSIKDTADAYYSIINGLVPPKWYFNAEQVKIKLTALVKTPAEIFGVKELPIKSFGVETNKGYAFYPDALKEIALAKTRVILIKSQGNTIYDYHIQIPNNYDGGFLVLENWLKDFREEEGE